MNAQNEEKKPGQQATQHQAAGQQATQHQAAGQQATHQAGAGHKEEHCSGTFEGKLVSLTGNKLVMANHEGHECSHTLATDAKLTRDGTACNPQDMKAGNKIRVTTKKDDRNVATRIEALDKHAAFAQIAG
jgi:hypothetical protein